MEIAMLAIRPVLAKLGDLLVGEFTLEKRARKGVESLVTEFTLMHAALHKVAKLPPEKLDEGVKIWAGKVRELSYEMEDIVDAFMVCVEDRGEPANPPKNKVKKLLKKITKLFKKGKGLHQISDALEEVVGQAKELADVRRRYELEMRDTADASTSVDPRMTALYTYVAELVGTEEKSKELIDMLTVGDDLSKHPPKTVSIVGFGGLGKTTLAKIVYDKIKVQFDCCAFVSVSQNPDTQKVLKNVLYELDKHKYGNIHNEKKEEKHLIDELIEFLTNKRKRGSEHFEPLVVENCWATKKARVNCRRNRSVPSDSVLDDEVPFVSVLDDEVPSVSVLHASLQPDSVSDAPVQTDSVSDAPVQTDSVLDAPVLEVVMQTEQNLSSDEVSSEEEQQLVWKRRPSATDAKKTKSVRVLCGLPAQSNGKKRNSRRRN